MITFLVRLCFRFQLVTRERVHEAHCVGYTGGGRNVCLCRSSFAGGKICVHCATRSLFTRRIPLLPFRLTLPLNFGNSESTTLTRITIFRQLTKEGRIVSEISSREKIKYRKNGRDNWPGRFIIFDGLIKMENFKGLIFVKRRQWG